MDHDETLITAMDEAGYYLKYHLGWNRTFTKTLNGFEIKISETKTGWLVYGFWHRTPKFKLPSYAFEFLSETIKDKDMAWIMANESRRMSASEKKYGMVEKEDKPKEHRKTCENCKNDCGKGEEITIKMNHTECKNFAWDTGHPSGKGNVFFSSDHHFGHSKIIGYCERPFTDCTEMDNKLIENWRNTVKDMDTVYYLGDFSMSGDFNLMVENYVSKLTGKIIFIHDNLSHDDWLNKFRVTNNERVQVSDNVYVLSPIHKIKYNGFEFFLSHYPMDSWPGSYHGSYHLHGHSHGSLCGKHNRYDVGVDTNNFSPISIDDVIKRMN